MPTYNGAFSFVLEVLLQALWSAFVWALPAAGLLTAAVYATGIGPWDFLATADGLVVLVEVTVVAAFATFPIYFRPRFSYAPALLVFLIAALLGSVSLSAAWTLLEFSEAPVADWAAFPAWISSHQEYPDRMFAYASLTVICLGALGAAMHWFGNLGSMTFFGLGRWWGRLLVGRDAFDAFAEREAGRIKQAYDDYVKQVRRE